MAKKNQVSCPECGQVFSGARASQARGAHLRHKHGQTAPGKDSRAAQIAVGNANATAIADEFRAPADSYVREALDKLGKREEYIRGELARIAELGRESEQLQRARNALRQALGELKRPAARAETAGKRKATSRAVA